MNVRRKKKAYRKAIECKCAEYIMDKEMAKHQADVRDNFFKGDNIKQLEHFFAITDKWLRVSRKNKYRTLPIPLNIINEVAIEMTETRIVLISDLSTWEGKFVNPDNHHESDKWYVNEVIGSNCTITVGKTIYTPDHLFDEEQNNKFREVGFNKEFTL